MKHNSGPYILAQLDLLIGDAVGLLAFSLYERLMTYTSVVDVLPGLQILTDRTVRYAVRPTSCHLIGRTGPEMQLCGNSEKL